MVQRSRVLRDAAKSIGVLAALMLANAAPAIDYESVAGGTWATPTNWNPVGTPGAGDTVTIYHGITLTGATSIDGVSIRAGGSLGLAFQTLNVAGDFEISSGSPDLTSGTVAFNGSARQEISGSPQFGGLTVNNTAATPSDTDAVVCLDAVSANGTTITDGQFMPADGSDFVGTITVNAAGILKPVSGASIIARASLNNFGSMVPNLSTVEFRGSGFQNVSGAAFHNIEVHNTAAVPGDANEVGVSVATATGTITVFDGQLQYNGTAGSIVVEPDGILQNSGFINFSGDATFEPGSTYTQSLATASFNPNGSARQEITGAITIGFMTVSNTAASPDDTNAVVFLSPITATGTVAVADGQLNIPDGSVMRNFYVQAGGIGKPNAAADIELTGHSPVFNNGGTFLHNNSTFTLTGSTTQALSATVPTAFWNLVIDSPAADPASNPISLGANVDVANMVTVADGQFNIQNLIGSVHIMPDGILRLQAPTNFSGDWTQDPGATFLHNNQTVAFNGSGLQTISGSPAFANLQINNTAATPSDTAAVIASDAISATAQLSVIDGQFMPANGSSFRNVSISAAGILKPAAGANFDITGAAASLAFVNNGTFVHNGGTITLTSNTEQLLTGIATVLNNVTVANTAATPDATNDASLASTMSFAGTLSVTDGQCTSLASGANVAIGADGILALGGGIQVSGNWTHTAGGGFIPGANSVTFNGTGPQSITGNTAFATLVINNSAAIPSDTDAVVTSGAISSAGQLTVTDGQFMPASGSAFRNVSISAAGILKPVAAANIELTGASGVTAFSNSGTFVHNGGTITLTSNTEQLVTGNATVLNNLTVANTAAVPDSTNDAGISSTITIAGTLSINDGQCTSSAPGAANVAIGADGILALTANLGVSGNWTHTAGGGFLPGSNSVTFNGTGPQSITGSTAFNALLINNSAPVPSDTDAVVASAAVSTAGQLTVSDGQFMPASGSSFRNISIQAAGVLKPVAAANIELTGASGVTAFANSGSFVHNGGTITLTSSTEQLVTGVATALNNLTVANTAAVPDSTNDVAIASTISIAGTLSVSDGQCTSSGSAAGNVSIGADGILALGATLGVSGNWTHAAGGGFIPGSNGVTFNGSGPQTITGSTAFNGLAIANTAAVPSDTDAVISMDAISSAGQLTINDGQFMPATGSAFRNISIAAAGILKPAAAATITVNGASGTSAFINAGGFQHNGSTFTFASSNAQDITGAPTVFNNLLIQNTAAVPDTTNDVAATNTVSSVGTLTVADGRFTTFGASFNHVALDPDGTLALSGTMNVAGNWTHAAGGAFLPGSNTVNFNGSAMQTIAGGTAFVGLTVNNTAAVPSDSAAVSTSSAISSTGALTVNDGQFMPATGSAFRDITVALNGILKPHAGATVTINGSNGSTALNCAGPIQPNGGTILFQSATQQAISALTAKTLFNVVVDNSAVSPDDTNDVVFTFPTYDIQGELTVLDGQCRFGGPVGDVVVGVNGILKGISAGGMVVRGDWTDSGTFLHGNSLVVFGGTGRQEITEPSPFRILQVNNSAPAPDAIECVETIGPVVAEVSTAVLDGRFAPASGSSTHHLSMSAPGILAPATGGTFEISGNTGVSGTILHNNGTIRFDGTASQGFTVNVPTALYNVEIANTAAVPSETDAVVATGDIAVANQFTVATGAAAGWNRLNSVSIDDSGLMFMGSSTVAVSGSFANLGAVDASLASVTFDAAGLQDIASTSPIAFGNLTVATGATLDEIGTADNLSVAGTLDIDGTLRRTRSIAGAGPVTGGLTAATVDFTTAGSVSGLVIDRIGSVPNATVDHTEAASWTFTPAGAGYTADVTLPHALAIPAQATVSRYLGTGTNWDFIQSSFTANSVTRTGISDLSSTWAVADRVNAAVGDWSALD